MVFDFCPNPLDSLKFFSNLPDELVGVCVQRVNTVFDFLANPLDSLKFFSNPPDELVRM